MAESSMAIEDESGKKHCQGYGVKRMVFGLSFSSLEGETETLPNTHVSVSAP